MRDSRRIQIGNLFIGGGEPIAVQSMLSVRADDIEGNVLQAKRLVEAGCDIIRVAVPKKENAILVSALKMAVNCPIVADIHFDSKIALEAIAAGADKIRINPGNIGSPERIKEVADACRLKGIPIRVGVNSGSVEKELLVKYGGPTAMALAESAVNNAKILEKFNFDNIVISIKSSDVRTMYDSCMLVSDMCDYPLHLGVTEAGTERMGMISSAAGTGGLLLAGIGDTIRVSLTDDPVKEVYAARDILAAVGLDASRPKLVSCPTCGRTQIDLISIARDVEERLRDVRSPIKVAVMGCAVNGPGEAKEADVGVAGGNGEGLIFRKGEIVRKVPEDRIIDELFSEIDSIVRNFERNGKNELQ